MEDRAIKEYILLQEKRNTLNMQIQLAIEESKRYAMTNEGLCAFFDECLHYSGFSCSECPHLGEIE